MPHRSPWLVAATLALTAHAAHAQRPVITENAEEPGRVPYRASRSMICTAGELTATFDAVPAGKRLVATFVSAILIVDTSSNNVLTVNNVSNLALNAPIFIPETLIAGISGSYSTIVASPVSTYFEPAESPMLFSHCQKGTSAAFTLIGYFVSIP